ncbi:hypothetical protein Poly30_26770 [Planctomycetes bacterium Poly30]|uniref:DUF3810 domain-containing protein n=1 Tax=Saltatorellus ferox TaxID=2528018 RepID=A0A518ESU4_9BACT|nr:hypothetical protein Poly30_26770 [Planctomycetes bacterium Poly30]
MPPSSQSPASPALRGRDWLWACAPALLGAAVTLVARAMPDRVEALYSRGLYPKIGSALNVLGARWAELTGADPGDLSVRRASLSEVLLGVFIGVVLVALWRSMRRGVGPLLRRVLSLGGAAYLVFLCVWGLNHARVPLARTLGLQLQPVSVESLNDAALELERDLGQLLREIAGLEDLENVASEAGSLAARAWAEAIEEEPALGWQRAAVTCAPLLSGALGASSITGIFSPFTQEAHVVEGLPAVDLAFTACHEIAHVQGWAREDEANYLAWRVGSRSGSVPLRIAAYTLALVHVHQALRKADPALQKRRALDLDARIVAVLQERSSFWERTRSRVATRAMERVNDTYLRSQGHGAGVASYGRMVDLIVAELR